MRGTCVASIDRPIEAVMIFSRTRQYAIQALIYLADLPLALPRR
ncbi:hypothetical protein SFMTTN_1018 [Sulfuriferula multivorans]|uniref:Uncharacterized protein n=1 Tax=Sulfuriferula multivorans TaxID=1559896 RepID=A0A401JCC1_9PROT|nr:hypothetical protein SFMTTN_1018 [Sulfuriferula multivorans]